MWMPTAVSGSSANLLTRSSGRPPPPSPSSRCRLGYHHAVRRRSPGAFSPSERRWAPRASERDTTSSGRRASPWPLLDALDDARAALASAPTPDGAQTMHWTLGAPADRACDIADAVARAGACTVDMARELVDMGAVYVDHWPEGKDGDDKREKWLRAEPGRVLQPGERTRIHLNPRRYRDGCWLGRDAWRARIIHEDDDLLVVCKPARLPTQAHESNASECLPGCVERALGLSRGALGVTHRLDSSTSGVTVLGKTKAAVAAFNASVCRKPSTPAVTKTYAALTRSDLPLPLGTAVHWMYPGPFGPEALRGAGLKRSQARLLRSVNVDGEMVHDGETRLRNWKRCELVVLECRRASAAAVARWEEAHARDVDTAHKTYPDEGAERGAVWEVRVELVTGRTHQVRAQLAAMGHPLLGDTLYAPMRGYLHEGAERDDEERDAEAAARVARGVVPDWPVALHAETLTWGERTFAAPPPWTRAEERDEKQTST